MVEQEVEAGARQRQTNEALSRMADSNGELILASRILVEASIHWVRAVERHVRAACDMTLLAPGDAQRLRDLVEPDGDGAVRMTASEYRDFARLLRLCEVPPAPAQG